MPNPRCISCGLQVHHETNQVDQNFDMTLRPHVAPHDPKRKTGTMAIWHDPKGPFPMAEEVSGDEETLHVDDSITLRSGPAMAPSLVAEAIWPI